MSLGDAISDIRPRVERSTLQMVQQAIRNGWDIPDQVREVLPKIVAKILVSGASDAAKLRAADTFLTMDRDNAERLFRLLEAEIAAGAQGVDANRPSDLRSQADEVLTIRIERMRKEHPDAFGSLERVVSAGLRRLGIAPGAAEGDGPPPP